MHKFSFNKQAGLNIDADVADTWHNDTPTLDIDELKKQNKQKAALKDIKARRAKRKREIQRSRQAFGVYTGTARDLGPGGRIDPSKIEFYHHSLEGLSGKTPRGERLTKFLRRKLEHPNSGYTVAMVPVTSYEMDPRKKKLAPRGLQVFVPSDINAPNPSAIPLEIRKARGLASWQSYSEALRGINDRAITSDDEFHPNNFWNILKNDGASEAIKSIFTDFRRITRVPEASEAALKVCRGCGRSVEDHFDDKDSVDEYTRNTGKRGVLHSFIPTYISSEYIDSRGKIANKIVDAGDERSAKSPLRLSLMPGRRSSDFRTAKLQIKRADEDFFDDDNSYMPLVHVFTAGKPGLLKRIVRSFTGLDQRGRPISPVVVHNTEKCSGENGLPCYNGKTQRRARDNETHCDCCGEPNKITYDPNTGEAVSRAIGNGRVVLLRKKDAPKCTKCGGAGYHLTVDKVDQKRVDCTSCAATGIDQTALDDSIGVECSNCHSPDSIINTNNDHVCGRCKGKGIVERGSTPTGKGEEQSEELTSVIRGNPVLLTPFIDSGSGIGYTAHAHKDCDFCGGDDDAQDENGMPCSGCSVAGLDEQKRYVSPPGMRYVHSDRIRIPEIMFQRAMSLAYPNQLENPHTRQTDFNVRDEKYDKIKTDSSGKSIVSYGLRGGNDIGFEPVIPEALHAIYTSGIELPDHIHQELLRRSDDHWSKPNAHYRAGSQELEDIHELVIPHLLSMPITVDKPKVVSPKVKRDKSGKITKIPLHQRVTDASADVEKALSKLSIHESIHREITGAVDDAYRHASNIEHSRDSGEPIGEDVWGRYNDSINRAIKLITDSSGADKAETFRKSLGGLPKYEPTPTGPENV